MMNFALEAVISTDYGVQLSVSDKMEWSTQVKRG